MDAAADGYLLIADITGYTGYMQASELEHARGILEGLFAGMLARLNSPFVLSNVQGDAILAYARADNVANGHSVLDTVEGIYFGFAHALEDMIHNTTCKCAACRNIANLDLKLLTHFGSYVEQTIGGRTELGGTDVIVVHRLMKNSITPDTGIRAYAAFTEAAANAIDIAPFFQALPRHQEEIDKLGSVQLRILDMRPLWEVHKDQEIVVADENQRWFPDVEGDVPAPLDRCWFYITDPDMRGKWVDNVVKLTRSQTANGRVQAGTVDHCAHGDGKTSVFTFVDWRPLEHTTFDISVPMNGRVRTTIFLTAKSGGTHVIVRTGKPTTSNPLTQTLLRAMSGRVAPGVRAGWVDSMERMQKLAEGDPAASSPVPSIAVAASDALSKVVGARMTLMSSD